MNKFFITLLICGLSLPLSASNKIPLEDFFKNPLRSSYELSPDGKKLAYLAPYKNRMNLFVDGKRLTNITDRDISGFIWKGNEYIVYTRDFNGDENYQLFRLDIKKREILALTPFKDVKTTIVDNLEYVNDDELLIGLNKDNPELFDVYRLNIITGELKLELKNSKNYMGWFTDHSGVIRLAISTDGSNRTYYYRKNATENFKKLMTLDFKKEFWPMLFNFDNKTIYALSNINRNTLAIVEFDPETKKELKLIYQNPEVDVENIGFSEQRKVLTSVTYYTDKRERFFLDKYFESLYNNIKKKLPERLEVSLVSSNKNEDKFIVRTFNDKTRGSYYLYDVKKDSIKKLIDLSPWLKESKMAEMIPIRYKSRDGLTIHGYLTLPKVEIAKKLPVVVNPHGGPWARDKWGFDPQVQFFANRGYAVLQINFRGSTGYGKKFWKAGFKQWGLKMQDDITDGVNWLIEQGIADPARIAIYGGSYGGYAALSGLTMTPNLYACGVSYVGVSNLFTFMNTIPPYWKPIRAKLYKMVGDPKKDKKQFERTSPVLNADKIKVPLFIAQGAQDPRVKKAESDQMVEALKKRGINVPYMVKENEGHGFENEENQMDFYRAMEDFLKNCLNKN